MGYLFSSFVWLYFIALIPMGYLVGRYGPKTVNSYGIGVWSIATVCMAFSTGFISLISCRLIMAVASDYLPGRRARGARLDAGQGTRHGHRRLP